MNLFNSFTRKKQVFEPLKKGEVSLYVCGITPNNATHMGHAFTYAATDVLVRFLEYQKYNVRYVQNATDVNDGDDVIKQATESGKTWQEIASYWIEHFQKQMKALNVKSPTSYVLASSVIEEIITMNKTLIEKGFAYEKKGNVYFDVKKFKDYGVLSKFGEQQMLMISQERGNDTKDPKKRNPLDFVLWIANEGEPHWDSPWSKGRPGWHIECSAMIHKALGDQIDIHGGGRDLIFPHHESEIAQSEASTGKKPFVNLWFHIGMVMYEGEKMSKSLGNLVLVEDVLKKHSADELRWLLLSHHYRHPWEYDEIEFDEICGKISCIFEKLKENDAGDITKVISHLDNDLDTPEALRYVMEHCSGKTLRSALDLLGFTFAGEDRKHS